MSSAPGTSVVRVRFAVLGPLRVWRGDEELDLGPPQQRLILAVLLVRGGQPVSVGELVGALWGTDPPHSAVNVLHRHVGLLRRLLEPDLPPRATGQWLIRDGHGYRLHVDADTSDVLRFRSLAAQARAAAANGEDADAVALFVKALDRWHGHCAAGLRPSEWAEPIFVAVDREYMSTVVHAADAALRAGLVKEILPIARLVALNAPLDEELIARLMLMLAASGHQAEALAAYQEVTKRLADELGIDPSPGLRTAHQQVLRQEGTGDRPASVAAQPEPAAERTDLVAPAQLPRDLSTFSGRDADLARILTSVRSPGATTTIALIDGMPGAGKTTLAVRLAYEVADDFPDGQLFVNLRGFDPRGSVMPPDEALRGFLYALGTPGSQIPADLDAQIGLYRSLLRDKRMLVVLDNARDADQVLPLIPGSPGCLVVVTSRNRLTGLVTIEGTHPFTLDPMPIDDARAMVKSRLGVQRSDREPEAVDQIVAMCARLPLALAIVAARAASYPDVPLSVIANELTDAKGSLDAFSYDGTSDLRAVFSWSYLALTPPTARMFRLLALHWGPDISLAAAASLLGVPVKAARKSLGELIRTRLMTEHLPGRYQFHDLVRVYAIELSDDLETEQERQDAIRRMADHYLHSAHSIHLVLRPHQQPVPISAPASNVTIETVADYAAAMAWFLAEHEVLHSVVVRAAECGFADHAWQLALTMQRYFQLQGQHLAWSATMRVALSAARASGDPVGEARTLRSLAGAYYFADDTETALAYLKQTDELLDQLGWTTEKAYVQRNMGDVLAKRNAFVEGIPDGADFAQAIKCYERAAELYRAAGHEQGEMFAIEGIAVCTLRMGAADEAIELLHQVLAGFERLGDRTGEANCLSELGWANLRVNRFDQAATYFRRAANMHRSDAYHYSELTDLLALGDALSQTSDIEGARAAWLKALALMDNSRITMIGRAAVSYNEVRQRIAALDQPR